MESIVILAIYGTVCYFIAKQGAKRKIGFELSLILCLLLSPLIGGLITILSPKVFKP